MAPLGRRGPPPIGREYLPPNYNFELEKTIRQIKRRGSKRVALQLPEGLQAYATVLSDVLRSATDVEAVVVLCDVVYGACCIDDVSASLLGCDLLVHYGHSCLVEIGKCKVPIMYVFVDIRINVDHCVSLAQRHLLGGGEEIAVMGTIQYNGAVRKIKERLEEAAERMRIEGPHSAQSEGGAGGPKVFVPKVHPLSSGEVLGCTSPVIRQRVVLFVADGRFHLESLMIRNPGARFFRYCPSAKAMTEETHDYPLFLSLRNEKVRRCAEAARFAIVFGTLGRQGSAKILRNVEASLEERGRAHETVFVSEIDEALVHRLSGHADCIIEIACPRICIDWGVTFDVPIVTPYEYFASLRGSALVHYEMDYYSRERNELWNNAAG